MNVLALAVWLLRGMLSDSTGQQKGLGGPGGMPVLEHLCYGLLVVFPGPGGATCHTRGD